MNLEGASKGSVGGQLTGGQCFVEALFLQNREIRFPLNSFVR